MRSFDRKSSRHNYEEVGLRPLKVTKRRDRERLYEPGMMKNLGNYGLKILQIYVRDRFVHFLK